MLRARLLLLLAAAVSSTAGLTVASCDFGRYSNFFAGLLILAGTIGFSVVAAYVMQRAPVILLKIFVVVAASFMLGFSLIYLPLIFITKAYEIPLRDAIPIYLHGLAVVVVSIACLVALVYMAFKYWTFLSNTWLAQLIKNNFCPRVRMCPTNVPCQSAQ